MADRSFVLLLVASVGTFAGYALLLPVVPLWAISGGAGAAGAGLTTGVFMGSTVLTQLAMPALLCRWGHRALTGWGSVVLGVLGLVFVVSSQLWVLVAVSLVRGIGFGMVTVAGSAMVAELLPPHQRGRGAGWYGLAVGLPNLLCLPAGVWIVASFGYFPVFALAALLPVAGAVAILGVVMPESARPGRLVARVAREAGKRSGAEDEQPRRFRYFGPFVAMTGVSVASGVLVTFLPSALSERTVVVPAALFGYAAALISCRWLSGMVGDRLGRPRLLIPATVLAVLGTAALFGAIVSAGSIVAPLAVGGAILLGAGFGAVQNDTLVMMFNRADSRGYGAASSAWNIAYDGGTGLGAFAIGLIAQAAGMGPAFAVTAVVVLTMLPVALAVRTGAPSRKPITDA